MKKTFKILKILFVINNIPLLPCAFATINSFLSNFMPVIWIWTRFFLGLTLPVVFLRCFYLPYITSAVIILTYIIALIRYKFPKKDTISFIVLLTICILGLISVETVFWAAMGV